MLYISRWAYWGYQDYRVYQADLNSHVPPNHQKYISTLPNRCGMSTRFLYARVYIPFEQCRFFSFKTSVLTFSSITSSLQNSLFWRLAIWTLWGRDQTSWLRKQLTLMSKLDSCLCPWSAQLINNINETIQYLDFFNKSCRF